MLLAADFDQSADRSQAGHSQKIDGRLGVAGSPQYAPLFRQQRRDVTRLHKVAGRRTRIGQRADRLGAAGRADAGPRVAVISRRLWETRFNADPNITSRSISLGGEPYSIVGVLSDFDFREFGPTPQVWTLFQFGDPTNGLHYFQVLGRLKQGVTLAQADERLRASAADYRTKFPNGLGPQGSFGVRGIRDVIVDWFY